MSDVNRWKRAIARAWKGEEEPLAFLLFVPEQYVRGHTDGPLVPIPDEIRRDLVDVLVAAPWSKRGRRPALDPAAAPLVRMQYAQYRNEGMSDAEARAKCCAFHKLKPGTLDDVLRARKTYAVKKVLKEPERLRRKSR